MNYVLAKFKCWNPMLFPAMRDRAFKNVIEFKWGKKGGALIHKTSVLIRRQRDIRNMWGYSKKVAVCHRWREVSGETKPANTLRMLKKKFLLVMVFCCDSSVEVICSLYWRNTGLISLIWLWSSGRKKAKLSKFLKIGYNTWDILFVTIMLDDWMFAYMNELIWDSY